MDLFISAISAHCALPILALVRSSFDWTRRSAFFSEPYQYAGPFGCGSYVAAHRTGAATSYPWCGLPAGGQRAQDRQAYLQAS
jgi:hypothetical protein